MNKRLNLPSTLIMKNKYKKLKTNEGCHQEEGRLQDIILVRRTLERQSQGLEVETYDNSSTHVRYLLYFFILNKVDVQSVYHPSHY